MGARKKLKMAMLDKGVKQAELAEKTGKKLQTIRNTFSNDSMTYATVEQFADILGCDVVLRDRKTGKLYR